MRSTIRKATPPDTVIESELPEGWVTVRLIDIAAEGPYPIGDGDHGQIKPAFYQRDGGVPYIRVADLGWGSLVPNGMVYIPEDVHNQNLKSELRPGDVLIAKTGATIGKCAIVPPRIRRANTTASIGKVTVNRTLTIPQWVLFYFLTDEFRQVMWSVSEKTAQPGFNNRDLKQFPIPLAPLTEQKRIAAKIGTLLNHVTKVRARLTRVAQILNRFRQSALATACSEGESLPLSEVVLDIKYGTAQKCTPVATGSPVLRIPNIGDGLVILDDLKYATLPPKELAALRLMPGDILMIRSNGSVSLVGKTALVSEREAGFAYAGYLIRLRANCDRILPEYLNLALQTHSIREQIEIPARSTSGVHNINSMEVLGLKINVPEMENQRKIVRRIETLFARANAIEKQVEAATIRAEKLTQAILAKAFRGELVPTEAEVARREGRDYEPTSALLARYKVDRSTTQADPNRRGARRNPRQIRSATKRGR